MREPVLWRNVKPGRSTARRFGIVASCALYVSARSRLHARALVFETRAGMRDFYRHALQHPPTGAFEAITTDLAEYVDEGDGRTSVRYDPETFAAMLFYRRGLSIETVCHEATHAAFAYSRRVRSPSWRDRLQQHPEERIAYPTGIICEQLLRWLASHGLVAL